MPASAQPSTSPFSQTLIERKYNPFVGAHPHRPLPHEALPETVLDGSCAVVSVVSPLDDVTTTWMPQWMQALYLRDCACAWLTLDDADNDPARFVRHLVVALQRSGLQTGDATLAHLSDTLASQFTSVTESLACDLAASPRRLMIMLADVHTLHNETVLDIIDWLLHYAPRLTQITLSSQNELPWRLGSLRVRGQLHEVNAGQLAFNHDEAALAQLPQRQLDLLMSLAMLPCFDLALACAATGDPDTGRQIQPLQKLGLILQGGTQHAFLYRLNALARDQLKQQFQKQAPEHARAVQMRSAHFCWARGEQEAAFEFAVAAQDWAQATQWLKDGLQDATQNRCELHLALSWIRAIPIDWLDRDPQIQVDYAFAMSLHPQQVDIAEQIRALHAIRQHLQQAAEPDMHTIDQIDCALSFQQVLSLSMTDQGQPARRAAQVWLTRWPHAKALHKGMIANVLCFGLKQTGELGAGLQMAHTARVWLEQDHAYFGLAWNTTLQALIHMKAGSYLQAQQTCEQGLHLIAQHLNGQRTHASVQHTLLAALAYERDDLVGAQQHLAQSLDSLAQVAAADVLVIGCLTRARLRFAQGDAKGGLSLLQEGRALALRRGMPRVSMSLLAETCVQLCRDGRHQEATELAQTHRLDDHLVAARCLLPLQAGQVWQALKAPIAHCATQGLVHKQVKLLITQAVAAHAHHLMADAQQALKLALILGSAQGYVRVFKDDQTALRPLMASIRPLLTEHPSALALWQHLHQPGHADAHAQGEDERSDQHGLTRREIDILQRLASGLSNKEIAQAIFISEGTLKWHLHNIYGKLDSKNRTGALTQARAMGVLSHAR